MEDKNIINHQLLHILYDEILEFYKNEENQKSYERWKEEHDNKQKKGT